MANVEVKQLYTMSGAVQMQRPFFFSSLPGLFSRHLFCKATCPAAVRPTDQPLPLPVHRTTACSRIGRSPRVACARPAAVAIVAVVAALLTSWPQAHASAVVPWAAFAFPDQGRPPTAPPVVGSAASPPARSADNPADLPLQSAAETTAPPPASHRPQTPRHTDHARDLGHVPHGPHFWLVSTRERHGCQYSPRVEWYGCSTGWQPSSLAALVASDDPDVVTVIYVHGNDTSAADARLVGMAAYRQLGLPRQGQQVRFIVWSWPSDRVRGSIARDARIKAAFAESEGYQLARFVSELSPGVPVSLVGFSFGARVITAGAHLLGGGSLKGQRLESAPPPRPLRTILLAAAVDRDWIVPGQRHGQALAVCEQMLLLVNGQDRVLRYYPRISADGRTGALGYCGAPTRLLGEHRDRLVQWKVQPYVGRAHGWEHYLYNGPLMNRLHSFVWFTTAR